MSDVNTVFLSGNLVRDPEVRYTPQGKAVCEFSIASKKRWVTESGEKREKANFVGCVCWGAKGEAFANHHRKGQRALIEGELDQETWEDKETRKKREKTKVKVKEWFFTGNAPQEGQAARGINPGTPSGRAAGSGDSRQPLATANQPELPTQDGGSTTEPEDDDVPF